jgi:uncharacterized protein DUF481
MKSGNTNIMNNSRIKKHMFQLFIIFILIQFFIQIVIAQKNFEITHTIEIASRFDKTRDQEERDESEIAASYNLKTLLRKRYYFNYLFETLIRSYPAEGEEEEEEEKDNRIDRDIKTEIDCGYETWDYFKLFLLTSYEYKESYNLDMRFNVGLGSKLVLSDSKFLFLQLSAVPLWNLEVFEGMPLNNTMRLSFGYNDTWYIVPDFFSFSAKLYYKPLYDNWKAYIVEYEENLTIEIYENLSLSLVYSWNTEKRPLVGNEESIEKFDDLGGVWVERYAQTKEIDYEKVNVRLELSFLF